jgi:hypothetical protein
MEESDSAKQQSGPIDRQPRQMNANPTINAAFFLGARFLNVFNAPSTTTIINQTN